MAITKRQRLRLPAYVLCAQCILGSVAMGLLAWQGALTGLMWLAVGLIIAAGVALVGWFGGHRWGQWLAIAQWGVQIPLLATPWFTWFIWFGLQLHVKLQVGEVIAGLNLYALMMVLWTLYLMQHPQREPLPVAATPVAEAGG